MNIKKISLLCLLILLVACHLKETKNSTSLKGKELVYPSNIKTTNLNLEQETNDLTSLANLIDKALFLNKKDMLYYKLKPELLSLTTKKSEEFIKKVMYITPLAHNFYIKHDDSQLAKGLFGVQCYLSEDFATQKNKAEKIHKTINYLYYEQCLNTKHQNFELTNLPLFKNNKGYLEVKNSEQLFYAVLHNYFPLCVRGSAAERVMSLALEILSQIVPANTNSYLTYQAIYNYIISNNQYDYVTSKDRKVKNHLNRSYFLEGSLIDNVSVCDGLAKGIVFLSHLMGIETYYIGAYNKEKGHAYVYVNIDGNYYLSCPTRALHQKKIRNETYAYHSNSFFLTNLETSDKDWPYHSLAYPEIAKKIDKPYQYYALSEFKIKDKTYNLSPTSLEETITILRAVYKLNQELNKSVEIELNGDINILRDAYLKMKLEAKNLQFIASGTFNQKRLQTYLFLGEENEKN